LNIKYVEPY